MKRPDPLPRPRRESARGFIASIHAGVRPRSRSSRIAGAALALGLMLHGACAQESAPAAPQSDAFAAVATLPFHDGFESGAFGPFWMVTGTGPFRSRVTSSNGPAEGQFHLTMDSSANGTNARNEVTLAVDLAGFTNVVLRFRVVGFNDESSAPPSNPFTNGANFDGVAISTDGTLWYEVAALRALSTIYAQRVVNLDAALASNGLAYSSNFFIRFNQFDNFPIPTDGIGIDAISLVGVRPGVASLFIDDVTVVEGTDTVTNASFTVRLNAPAAQPVTVDFATMSSTATSGSDFVPASGSLNFQPGETNKMVIVPVIGDAVDEPNETFYVVLSNAVNAAIADDQALGTILNDDQTIVTVTNITVIEGDTGTTDGVFQVNLSKPALTAVAISFSTSAGTASAGTDYLTTNGVVLIPAGQTNGSFVVRVIGDVQAETNEFFFVSFAGPSNVVFNPAFSTATIIDDDSLPGKLHHFAFDPIASPQRTGNPFPVTVRALDPFEAPVTNFAGPAVLSAVAGLPEVKVGTGSTTWEYPLATFFHDARVQTIYRAGELGGARQIRSLALDVASLPGQSMTNWTIRLKHTPLASYGVNPGWESTGWTTVFQTNLTVTATGTLVFNFAVPFDYNGTDNLMVDFSFNNTTFTSDGFIRATPMSGSRSLFFRTDSGFGDPLSWAARSPAPGASTLVPNIELNGGVQTAILVAPTSTGSFTNGVWSGAVAVLMADENIALVAGDGAGHTNRSAPFAAFDGPALIVNSVGIDEGAADHTLLIDVSMGIPADQVVSVGFMTVEGTAGADADFIATNGVVVFQPGETIKSIPITIRGDTVPELNESFSIVLSSPSNVTIFRGTANVLLRNDDAYAPLASGARLDSWQFNGNVNAIIETNGVVYVGGSFTETGGTNTGNLITARRGNGELFPGFPLIERNVNAIVDDGAGGWFIGGTFLSVGGQPRFRLAHVLPDLSVDPNFAPAFSSTVNSLHLDGTNLYAGGVFTAITNAGTVYTRVRLAVLDSATGEPRTLPTTLAFDNTVTALATANGKLYAGGTFLAVTNEAGTQNRFRIAAMDLASGQVTDLANEFNATVNTLAVAGNRLYVGGDFTMVDAFDRFRMAAFDTVTDQLESWSPAFSGSVITVLPAGDVVYVGGLFGFITNGATTYVRSNLAALSPATGEPNLFNPTANNAVRALALEGTELFVGGSFTAFGGQGNRRRLASFNFANGVTTAFDPDTSGNVVAISARSNFVMAGGAFAFVKGTTRNRLAAFDAGNGSLLPWNPNANNTVFALAPGDNELFAGGQFTTLGGQTRTRLAAIDPVSAQSRTNFTPNPDGIVRALASRAGTLFVGGDFTNVAGAIGRGLAAVNAADGATVAGFSPNAIPPAGVSSNVLALALDRTTLYVGGTFTSFAGAPRWRAAALDLGSGELLPWRPSFPTNVLALATWYTNIYVGGEFTTLTNTSGATMNRNRIAAIGAAGGDATSWNPNANNAVYSLAVVGTNVYAGGNFTTIGARPHNRLAELNPLLPGTNASVWTPDLNSTALAIAGGDGGRIYAGGAFISVNNESRRNFAVFSEATAPSVTVATNALVFTENDAARNVDPSLAIVSAQSSHLIGALIRVAAGYRMAEDVFTVNPTPGIGVTYELSSGQIALDGIASVAAYESALRSLTYRNTSENPDPASRVIDFSVTDPLGAVTVASREIRVLPVNDAPAFVAGPDVTLAEDAAPQTFTNWATGIVAGPAAESAQALTFLVSSDNPALFGAAPAITQDGTLNFAPAPDAFGSAIVSVVLMDDGGTTNGGVDTSAPQTFRITITPVNDPPVVHPLSVTLDEDAPTPIALNATDADGDGLTYSFTAPSHGSLSGVAPNLVYTPAANYHGPDGFVFRVSDGQVMSGSAAVTLTVVSVNDPPVADASATVAAVISPNNTNAVVYLDGSRSSDVENDPLQFTWYHAGASNALATGAVAPVTLPVGSNQLLLAVSDGTATGTSAFAVVVLTAADAVQTLIDRITSSGVPRNARPLVATLEAAQASFARGNFISGVNQLQAFQNQVRAQVAPEDATLAQQLIDAVQEVIDAVDSPEGVTGISGPATPPRIQSAAKTADGRIKLRFHGRAGRTHLVQCSTNLADWVTVGTARQIERGVFEFEDAGSPKHPQRFFRVVVP